MILFVFHFPAILLVTLNKPWHLIGCFVFSVGSSLAGKKRQFKAKMVRFAPIRANQITGTTSDFKMGVTERGIALVHEVILFRFYVTITTIVKLSQSFQQNHFHLLKSQKQKKAFFKVSLRFFPVLKWTTNSWRGIKKPLSLAKSEKVLWTRPRNSTKQNEEATTEEVPGSIVIYTEEEINTLNRDVKLSALSLGHFISFSFATKDVKGVNYFPSRANDFEIWKKFFEINGL